MAPDTTQADPYQGYRLTTSAQPTGTITAGQPSDMTLDFGLTDRTLTPVTLSSLYATPSSGGVTIAWKTISEIGTARFRVLRSFTTPDRAKAVEVGQRLSQGSTGGTYSVLDTATSAGPRYYWLIEVTRNGEEHVIAGPFAPNSGNLIHTVYLSIITR